jgi:hypothetical protein
MHVIAQALANEHDGDRRGQSTFHEQEMNKDNSTSETIEVQA